MSRPGTPPEVLVVLGTDHHRFDRLVDWIDDWIDDWLESRAGAAPVCLVQHGTSRTPRRAEGVPYLDHSEVEALMRQARVVVSHGGPTTITEARRAGHSPVVVPRRSRLGEHVDDHQVRFVARLAEAGLVERPDTFEELCAAVERRLSHPTASATRAASGDDPGEAARRFGQVVAEVLRR